MNNVLGLSVKRHADGLSFTELLLIEQLADLIDFRVESKNADVKLSEYALQEEVKKEVELMVQAIDNLMDSD
jgi:DNA replication protein DnaD